MNDKMQQLVLLAAVAIYLKKGVAEAIVYLRSNGMSMDEAVDWLALFDGYMFLAENGQIKPLR